MIRFALAFIALCAIAGIGKQFTTAAPMDTLYLAALFALGLVGGALTMIALMEDGK